MMNEHGFCQNCGTDLDGGSIWEHFFKETHSKAEADRIASEYGATQEKGKWGRAIAIYDQYADCTVSFKCPDCGYIWKRYK